MKVSSSSEEFYNLPPDQRAARLYCFPGLVNVLFGFTLTTGRRYFYTRQLKARQFSKESLRTNTRQQESLWKNRSNNLWLENGGINTNWRTHSAFHFILTPAGGKAITNVLGINYWENYISTVIVWRSKESSWHVTNAEKMGEMIRWGEGRRSTGLTKRCIFKWNKGTNMIIQ